MKESQMSKAVIPSLTRKLFNMALEIGDDVIARMKDGNKVVSKVEDNANENVTISVPNAKWWSPDSPFLYNLLPTHHSRYLTTQEFY